MSDTWSDEEMRTSSTLREILAVKFVLLSLLDQLSGLTVKWFTDNQNVPRIVSSGSSKGLKHCPSLTFVAVVVFQLRWSGFQELRMIRLIF